MPATNSVDVLVNGMGADSVKKTLYAALSVSSIGDDLEIRLSCFLPVHSRLALYNLRRLNVESVVNLMALSLATATVEVYLRVVSRSGAIVWRRTVRRNVAVVGTKRGSFSGRTRRAINEKTRVVCCVLPT